MKVYKNLRIITLLLLLLCTINALAQDVNEDEDNLPENFRRQKGFHIGAFLGGYVPNKYTAYNYDGYGFDLDGNKNNFDNSWIRQKIEIQYGGRDGTNQPDQIAIALGVDPGANPKEWAFEETDMPSNMKYQFGFLLGVNTQYLINAKNGIVLNANFAKLIVTGNFTMYAKPPSNSSQINKAIKTFGIVGGEQRLLLQLGYQRILGNNQKNNFFIEGGVNVTSSKFDKNEIQINNLTIDLASNYNQIQYPSTTYYIRKPSKTGIGVFAGFGLDLVIGKKVIGQIVYQPSYEKINIGINPKLKLQHSAGLRVYYRL